MSEYSKFVQALAKFRGITPEEAQKQYDTDNNIEEAEALMTKGHYVPLAEVASPLFKTQQLRTVIVENGRLLPRSRPMTQEEVEEALVAETEQKMTAPDTELLQQRMAAAVQIPAHILLGQSVQVTLVPKSSEDMGQVLEAFRKKGEK